MKGLTQGSQLSGGKFGIQSSVFMNEKLYQSILCYFPNFNCRIMEMLKVIELCNRSCKMDICHFFIQLRALPRSPQSPSKISVNFLASETFCFLRPAPATFLQRTIFQLLGCVHIYRKPVVLGNSHPFRVHSQPMEELEEQKILAHFSYNGIIYGNFHSGLSFHTLLSE